MQIQALTSLVSGVVPDLLPSSMSELHSQGPAGWQRLSRPPIAPGFSTAFLPAWPVCSGYSWNRQCLLSLLHPLLCWDAHLPWKPASSPWEKQPSLKLHCTASHQPVSVIRPRLLNNHANYLPHKYHFSPELNPHYADNLTLEACTLYYLR